jgi:hypothetical protein
MAHRDGKQALRDVSGGWRSWNKVIPDPDTLNYQDQVLPNRSVKVRTLLLQQLSLG